MSIRSKKDLTVELSKLKKIDRPSLELEQYSTLPNLAAEWVWSMALKGEVAGKVILDAGCGSGILGLGLLLMGAKKVFFIDKDQPAMAICRENYAHLGQNYEISKAEFIISDITLFDSTTDIVVQNPPFGTKLEHADRKFLVKAFQTAPIVYSLHKYSTAQFVAALAHDYHFKITDLWRWEFPILAAFKFHEKPVKNIDVGLWRMEMIK